MINLTQDEKGFITNKLKPLLKKNDRQKVVKLCIQNNMQNALAWLIENGIDILSEMDSIPSGMFKNCDIGSITIPSSIHTIGNNAFEGSELSVVIFEDGVESIGNKAFANTNISRVALPESLLKIGVSCFEGCTHLSEVYIPDSITVLPHGLFYDCSDSIKLMARSRKHLPPSKRLHCPQNETDWYIQHLVTKED